MAHNTSGLPPLNLDPFDPSDLYAAARSNTSVGSGNRLSRVSRRLLGLSSLVALLVVVGATALLT